MQFRTRTLLVMMATVAVLLALTSGAAMPVRVGVWVSMLLTWLGFGLIGAAARGLDRPQIGPIVLGVAGVGLTALALSAGILLTGLALQVRFAGP